MNQKNFRNKIYTIRLSIASLMYKHGLMQGLQLYPNCFLLDYNLSDRKERYYNYYTACITHVTDKDSAVDVCTMKQVVGFTDVWPKNNYILLIITSHL